MDFKLVVFVESFAAVRAAVRPLACVDPLVDAQLALVAIALPAQVTGEGSFSCVRALVVLQEIGSVEPLPALAADVHLLRALRSHLDAA